MFNTSVVGVQLVVKKCTWARSPRFVVCVGGSTPLASIIFSRRRRRDFFTGVIYCCCCSHQRSLCVPISTQIHPHEQTHEEQHTKKKRDDFPTTLSLFLCLRESSSLRERESLRVLNARVLYMYIYKNGLLLVLVTKSIYIIYIRTTEY